LALVLSAALVFVLLFLTGVVTVEEFADNPEVRTLADPTLREILTAACGAVAGMVMIVPYREYLIPGALIALEIIEAVAITGVVLAVGEPALFTKE